MIKKPLKVFRTTTLGRFLSPSRFPRSIVTIHKGVWLCGIAKGEDRITRCPTEVVTFTAKQRGAIRFPDIYMSYMRPESTIARKSSILIVNGRSIELVDLTLFLD